MDSSMSMSMSMATMTTSGMPMSTGMSGMGGSMDGGMMDGMMTMPMVFFTSTTTPLYSTTWTPENSGQYAGNCIFLIVFAALFRALLAIRVNLFSIRNAAQWSNKGGLIYPYPTGPTTTVRPWRASEAVMTAALDMVLAGVSYLLMLAVMTYNVGYFLSVLAGVFVGSLLWGRFVANAGGAH